MIVRSTSLRPVELAFGLVDRMLVDARDAALHQAVFAEFPVLIAVGAEPLAAIIAVLIGKAHGDAVLCESPQFFDQAVVEFTIPFAR